jgi:RNA polymerase sigma-70 factor, ECF subfamily
MTVSNEELAQRHLHGDQMAFRQLVEQNSRVVFNLAYRLTEDRLDAEDITQETFFRVYNALPRTRLDMPLKPWLLRIALNLCRNRARKQHAKDFDYADLDGTGEEDGEEPLGERLADGHPLPLERLLASEQADVVHQAVQALPVPYRAVVVLRYTEDLSYDEIAGVLELPINTVRTHLYRAKDMLRRQLCNDAEERTDAMQGHQNQVGGVSNRGVDRTGSSGSVRTPGNVCRLSGASVGR